MAPMIRHSSNLAIQFILELNESHSMIKFGLWESVTLLINISLIVLGSYRLAEFRCSEESAKLIRVNDIGGDGFCLGIK